MENLNENTIYKIRTNQVCEWGAQTFLPSREYTVKGRVAIAIQEFILSAEPVNE